MQYLARLAQKPARFLRDKFNSSMLILSGLIFLILCAFTSFARSAARPSEVIVNTNKPDAMSSGMTATVTSTKWWIKLTATPSPSMLSAPTASAESDAHNCLKLFSPYIRTEIYAYIALTPPVPNRIREGANLSSEYLGQI